jgi:hypothetical protein
MADNKKNGLGSVPSRLFRPTTEDAQKLPPEPVETPDEPADPGDAAPAAEERGRGEAPTARSRSTRAARPGRKRVSSGKTQGRKLHLTDDTFDRLQYQAIQRRSTVSFVAEEVLAKYLPRFDVKRVS